MKPEIVLLTMGTMPSEEQTTFAPKEETSWGMAVQELTSQLAQHLGLEPGTVGVVISDIKEESPAAKAGLSPGDLITEINRKSVNNLNDYQQALKSVKNAENLLLIVKRDARTFFVVLIPLS
jgi:serine protease Do